MVHQSHDFISSPATFQTPPEAIHLETKPDAEIPPLQVEAVRRVVIRLRLVAVTIRAVVVVLVTVLVAVGVAVVMTMVVTVVMAMVVTVIVAVVAVTTVLSVRGRSEQAAE